MIYLDGVPVNPTVFPDNTSQVWKLDLSVLGTFPVVRWEYQFEGEFMHLAQLVDLLEAKGHFPTLHLSYLPYGRQDKEVSNETTFALKTFIKLLNTLDFFHVVVMDPHSEEVWDINNLEVTYPRREVQLAFDGCGADVVCYPDRGAARKYTGIYDFPYVHCSKERNQSTGEITNMELEGDVFGKVVLIVDDICDGGATFEKTARLLYDFGAAEVNLFVTHGLFKRGVKGLRSAGNKRIFCTKGEAFPCGELVSFKEFI